MEKCRITVSLLEAESRPVQGPTGFTTPPGQLQMHCATTEMPSAGDNHQPTRTLVSDGNSSVLMCIKENNDTESTTTTSRLSKFLNLPLELRQNIYQHLFQGEDILSTAVVPQRSSQVHVGISTYLPGSNILATCKKIREEGRRYLFGRIHFTTQYSSNGFVALRRFNWHKTSMALVQSLDLHTSSLLDNDFAPWASGLHLLIEKMPNLKYLRISTAFRGDMIDDTLMALRGEDLFSALPYIQAYLLRFGAFITLRHPTLRTLAWSKPTGDTHLIDDVDGVVHNAIKLVADSTLLGRKDKIISSTVVRQETLAALTLAHAKDLQSPLASLDSEGPLDLSHKNNESRRAAHLAVSGVEHLAYLTSTERRRLGLTRQLDFDVLIQQARTGLLASKYAPMYPALQLARASIAQKEGILINVATGEPLHVLSESARDNFDQLVATTPHVQPIGGRSSGRMFKRGDLVEYMMGHADYLDTIDEAFALADLPKSLKPVKAKKQRVLKIKKR